SSSSSSSRSRAVSLPLPCCAAMRFSPPPWRACSRFFSSWALMSCMVWSSSVFRLSCREEIEQRARCGGWGDACLDDVAQGLRECVVHGGVVLEVVLQPGVDQVPHPRERLLLAARIEL